MRPGHVVQDLSFLHVVNLESSLASTEHRPVVTEIDFRQQARRREQAIVISPLGANFVYQVRRQYAGQSPLDALARAVERQIVGDGGVGLSCGSVEGQPELS